jgi:hypothetical protein
MKVIEITIKSMKGLVHFKSKKLDLKKLKLTRILQK